MFFSSPLGGVLILPCSTLKNGALLVLAQLFIYKKIIVTYSKFKACNLFSRFLLLSFCLAYLYFSKLYNYMKLCEERRRWPVHLDILELFIYYSC